MSYGYKQAKELVSRELKMQGLLAKKKDVPQVLNIPLILGPVGGGKTSIARDIAIAQEMMYAPINCGENSDAVDLTGVPVPSMVKKLMVEGTTEEQREARGYYMQWVLNRYAATACMQPVMLFFDDLDKAPPPVQNALIGVGGTRTFRDQQLHEGSLLVAAGNRVDDDTFAGEISESMRTRMTIIEMVPDVISFSEYGVATKEIHPVVIGYLQFKPDQLHQWKDGAYRFPTPRGWWEVSQQFFVFTDPTEDVFRNGGGDYWKHIVSLKCGDPVSADFWAWYTIISQVDVKAILTTGNLPLPTDPDKRRMAQYAAVFAVSQELNTNGVKPSYRGLAGFAAALDPEMRIAMVVQITRPVRQSISTMFPATADMIMSDIVPTASDPTKFKLQPPKKDPK